MNLMMKRMMREDVQTEESVLGLRPGNRHNWMPRDLGLYTNSTTIITDLTTVKNAITSTQRTRAIAAAGPIEDLDGNVALCILKAQEIKVAMNYMLYGNQAGTGASGNSSALIQSGDGTIYSTAVGVYNDLS